MSELQYGLTFIERFICAWHSNKDFMDITVFILMDILMIHMLLSLVYLVWHREVK